MIDEKRLYNRVILPLTHYWNNTKPGSDYELELGQSFAPTVHVIIT